MLCKSQASHADRGHAGHSGTRSFLCLFTKHILCRIYNSHGCLTGHAGNEGYTGHVVMQFMQVVQVMPFMQNILDMSIVFKSRRSC